MMRHVGKHCATTCDLFRLDGPVISFPVTLYHKLNVELASARQPGDVSSTRHQSNDADSADAPRAAGPILEMQAAFCTEKGAQLALASRLSSSFPHYSKNLISLCRRE